MVARAPLLALAIAAASPCANVGAIAPGLTAPAGPECGGPRAVLASFYQSVEQGRLVVFGRTVARHQLRPLRVEFGYALDSQARTITVQSTLTVDIPVPGDDTMSVRYIDVVMDGDGQFIESRTHVYLR